MVLMMVLGSMILYTSSVYWLLLGNALQCMP